MSFNDFPAEVLAIIFKNYINTEGHLEFLKNVIPVCKIWRDVALSSPSLIKMVDIAGFEGMKRKYLPESVLESMKWCFQKATTELRISNVWFDGHISCLAFSGCPNIKSLVLSNCRVHGDIFEDIVRYCKKLESMSIETLNQNGAFLRRSTLEPVLLAGGPNLRIVSLSNLIFHGKIGHPDLVVAIVSNCPHLEQLEVSHVGDFPQSSAAVNEEKPRTSCSKLRAITLERYVSFQPYVPAAWQTVEFPNLEKVVFLGNFGRFQNVLRSSEQLKELTIEHAYRGARRIFRDVGSLSLEKLQLVDVDFEVSDLQTVVPRWTHSLKELKLMAQSTDEVLLALVGNYREPVLEILDVSGSVLRAPAVLAHVLRECKKLKELNTSNCLILPEAYQGKYCTADALSSLQQSLPQSRATSVD